MGVAAQFRAKVNHIQKKKLPFIILLRASVCVLGKWPRQIHHHFYMVTHPFHEGI